MTAISLLGRLLLVVFCLNSVSAATEHCFRGLQLGKSYHYQFATDLSFSKKQLDGAHVARESARKFKVDLDASLTPVAEGSDDDALHVRLEIARSHIRDLEGWQAYDDGEGELEGVDPDAADAQLLELLQQPFYFTQHCDMSVTDLHFPEDEQNFAVNLKQQLVVAFAHKVIDAAEYEHLTSDQFGAKTARVTRTGDTLQSVVDGTRPVPMLVKRQNDGVGDDGTHIVDMDSREHATASFADGVVHTYRMEQTHQFPGRNTRDEMADDAARAENIKHDDADAMNDHTTRGYTHTDQRDLHKERFAAAAAGIQIHAFAATTASLTATRLRRLRAADPQRVATFAAYAEVVHGTESPLVTRRFGDGLVHQLQRKSLGGADADAELARHLFSVSDDGAELDALLALLNDARLGHAAWRTLLHRVRVAVASDDATLFKQLRAAVFAALPHDTSDVEHADDAELPHVSMPHDALQHVLSLLAEVGGAEAEAVLLEAAMRSPDHSLSRNQALLALAGIRSANEATIAALSERVRACSCAEPLCVQLTLTLGAMANELHHRGKTQLAHDVRELLFVRLAANRADRSCATVFAIALNNTMYQVELDDERLFKVEVGRWLRTSDGDAASELLFDGSLLNEQYSFENELEDEVATAAQHDDRNATRKRGMAPVPTLSLSAVLGGKSGTSGWKKWYEGWSFSSRKNEYLPGGGIDQSGQNWGLPSDTPGEPQFGLNGLNKDGKGKDKGLLQRCSGMYRDGTPCASKHYDNWVPKNPDKGWEKKIGSGQFYAMVEAALHKRADGMKKKSLFYFELEFFAGAQFSASLMGKKVPILAAYARANVSITDERDKCSFFDVGLFYFYFGKMFFWGIGSGDCQYVDSTCKPWFPEDRSQMGYLQFAHEVFFELTFTFALGPIPMVVFIEGVGGAGMYYSVDMIFAPALKDKNGNECGGIDDGGGSMLNGYCEPEAYISLAAELGIGIPVLSAGIGVQVELIRVSLPASAGLNFITQRPCFGIGVSVGALGGRIYLWARIGLCKGWFKICIKLSKTIYDWKGLAWEQPLLRVDCCKPCPGACNNAWCDYKNGVCVCNDGWGGKLCNMVCPLECKDIATINPGVNCMINPDPNSHGELCECKEGYFGWNCLVPCPGIRANDPQPQQICSGHGICSEFGYQSSTGFGINRDVEDTLVAHCACEDNYFGERCDITCPPDPETGRVCGGGGGVCVFDGQRAFCQCLKGYAGPECKARCPLFRGSPCGYRGDCIWQDGRATCHCHNGFSGAGCDLIDTSGSGRALLFDATKRYYAEVPDAVKLRAPSDVYTVGFWFKPLAALPAVDVTLHTWRWGRVLLVVQPPAYNTAELAFCDARPARERTGCVFSPITVQLGDNAPWQFVFVSVASFELAHDLQMWHGVPRDSANGGACVAQPAPYDAWCVADVNTHENSDFNPVKGSFRFGLNFTGAIDNLFVYGDRPTTAEVNERAHHVPEPDANNLLYGAMFDEGRGDVFYDERQLMSGQIVFSGYMGFERNAVPPQLIWANPSGVHLMTGAQYSNMTDTFTVGNGTAPTILFHFNLQGAKLQSANLHFQWGVPAPALCPLTIELIDAVDGALAIPLTDENGRPKMLNGHGEESVPLGMAQMTRLRAITGIRFTSGRDSVAGGQCEVSIDQAFLEALAPTADPMLEFTGRPSAFAFSNRHKALRLPFTVEMWLIRPALLRSNRGLLLSLIDASANATLASVDGPFLLYETGFPRLGLQYRFQGQTNKVLAGGHDVPDRYTVPGGEWVHLAVTVEPSATSGKCMHRFMINGETGPLRGVGDRTGFGEVLDYPGPMAQLLQGDKPNYCSPGGALEGWGDARFNLRIGAKFLGAVNDVRIHTRALSQAEVRASMLLRNSASTALLHDWSFSNVMRGGDKNEPVVLPDMAGGATLTMNDGAHLGLIVAVEHDWHYCPGISFQFPESVCSSEPTHTHGVCVKPRSVREDERNSEANEEREKGYTCNCVEGYRSGVGGDCAIECPGGYLNPCSGHGRCVGSVAPIEAWENSDGTENTSYVGADPNVHDRQQSDEVSCVCDDGYVGPSCNYECPGWSEPWNRPQRLCSGYGSCNYTVSGGATCSCFDSSQRYGPACEFLYGNNPDAVVTECGLCNGANEQCRDTLCLCVDGYFRVFGQCRAHIDEAEAKDNSVASYAAAFTVLALFCFCVAALGALYFLKLK